jgi:3-phosphoshikimate 1-carboxyvinyltransferase
MNLMVSPGYALRGSVRLPGDKSLSHRAALFAALAQGESHIENFLVSGVTRAMLDALSLLGVPWQLEGSLLRVRGAGVDGLNRQANGSPVTIHCGNSATTLRLLAGALTAAGTPAVLDGSPGLRRRPMNRIVEPLQQMGVRIESSQGCAPLTLHPSPMPLKPLTYTLPVASAQVKSCILLAALAAEGPTTLTEPGPSRDHTERMLRSMGVEIEKMKAKGERMKNQEGATLHPSSFIPHPLSFYKTRLTPPTPLSLTPLHFSIPGDLSSAAFLIVAALITPGSEISIEEVGLNPTRTGLLDALQAMGAQIQVTQQAERQGEPVGSLRVRYSLLHGTQVSGPLVVRMIDEFPAFAVAAAFARGETKVSEAEELRNKESDRILALCRQLRLLGIPAQDTADGFILSGAGEPPMGSAGSEGVDSCGDHRLAMALSLVGLASQAPVTVRGAEIISESFPEFVSILSHLGAKIEDKS